MINATKLNCLENVMFTTVALFVTPWLLLGLNTYILNIMLTEKKQ